MNSEQNHILLVILGLGHYLIAFNVLVGDG